MQPGYINAQALLWLIEIILDTDFSLINHRKIVDFNFLSLIVIQVIACWISSRIFLEGKI